MSVLVTLRVQGDATKLEQEDPELMRGIVERAKECGVISHRFWGSDQELLVVDEWPDEGSFQKFFASSPDIAGMMERAGVKTEPEVRFWRKLDTGDDVG
jgi:hypothetical protein